MKNLISYIFFAIIVTGYSYHSDSFKNFIQNIPNEVNHFLDINKSIISEKKVTLSATKENLLLRGSDFYSDIDYQKKFKELENSSTIKEI